MTFQASALSLNDLCFDNGEVLVKYANELIMKSIYYQLQIFYIVLPENAHEWTNNESFSNILDAFALLIEKNQNY